MLITDLSNVKSIQIVEREKLESLLKEIDLGEGKFIDPNTAQKLGKGLGAGYMLTGSFLIMGETMRIDARLVDVGTGEVTMAEEITGEVNTFFELEKILKNKLIQSLNIDLSKTESRRIKKSQTESFEAFSAYSSSLDAFDKGEFEKSAEFLEIATESDEDFDLAWEKLEEIEKKIADIIAARGAGFDSEMIKIIDELEGLEDRDCNQFFNKFLEMSGGFGDFIFEIYNMADHPDSIEKDPLFWQKHGVSSVPTTQDDLIYEVGSYLGKMMKMVEYLENKKYPDTYCGSENPNAYAYYSIIATLSSLHGAPTQTDAIGGFADMEDSHLKAYLRNAMLLNQNLDVIIETWVTQNPHKNEYLINVGTDDLRQWIEQIRSEYEEVTKRNNNISRSKKRIKIYEKELESMLNPDDSEKPKEVNYSGTGKSPQEIRKEFLKREQDQYKRESKLQQKIRLLNKIEETYKKLFRAMPGSGTERVKEKMGSRWIEKPIRIKMPEEPRNLSQKLRKQHYDLKTKTWNPPEMENEYKRLREMPRQVYLSLLKKTLYDWPVQSFEKKCPPMPVMEDYIPSRPILIDALDHSGNIIMSADERDKAIIAYGTKFFGRFPKSQFFNLVEPHVADAILREKQKN
jgi:TolB-like protein